METRASALNIPSENQTMSLLPEGSIHEFVQGRHGNFLALKNDMYIGGSLINYGEYSENEWRLLEQIIPEGGVVVEVGAHLGALTIPICKKVGPKGKVLAFEPQPVLFQTLCANLSLNGLLNTYAFNKACGDQESTLRIPDIDYRNEGNYGGIKMEMFKACEIGQEIEIVPLDSYQLQNLNLLKLDVEGMELDVLKGAQKTIEKLKPVIYAENHFEDGAKEVITFLLEAGYNIWQHQVRLYSEDNFFKNTENKYGTMGSINILCIDVKNQVNIDLPQIKSLDDLN